jgi:hypothetical protein
LEKFMADVMQGAMVREAVGVFKRPADLQGAIDTLLSSGFHRASLSLLASEHAVRQKLTHWYGQVSALADDASIPRVAYTSPEAIGGAEGAVIGALMYVGAVAATGVVVASGGTLAALIVATTVAGGTGALVGSVLGKFIGDHHARRLQEQLEHGGLLLWVRTWDEDDERKAMKILKSHGAAGVHVHGLPAPSNISPPLAPASL